MTHLRDNGVNLSGKVAIVTGSGRSLGRAYAQALAAAGVSVVVNDIDQASAQETVTSITSSGGKAVAVIAPVGPSETAQQLVDSALANFGRLDILVANAGVLRDRVLWKMEDSDFDLVVETHLRGTFTCGRAAAIAMREQGEGGRIIVIGSPAGQFGNFGQTNYSAVKAGLVAMARTWSLELAKSEITANAVIPTALSPMVATMPMYSQVYEDFVKTGQVPVEYRKNHALGAPEDVAPLVLWLASDLSKDVTGQAIGIGGDRLTLYSHPQVLKTEDHDQGWTAAEIDTAWRKQFENLSQPSGPQFSD